MQSSGLVKREHPEDSESLSSPNKCSGCNCERSMCLKMYCQCFAEGKYCTGCNCQNCQNRVNNKVPYYLFKHNS